MANNNKWYQFDINSSGSGIKWIFHQFLNHTCNWRDNLRTGQLANRWFL